MEDLSFNSVSRSLMAAKQLEKQSVDDSSSKTVKQRVRFISLCN
jgi:hypothetical protein